MSHIYRMDSVNFKFMDTIHNDADSFYFMDIHKLTLIDDFRDIRVRSFIFYDKNSNTLDFTNVEVYILPKSKMMRKLCVRYKEFLKYNEDKRFVIKGFKRIDNCLIIHN